jgi:PIN domain nuclease of toxin-antitoxin system
MSLHRDPFDRMLVAQAQAEGLILMTSDTNIGLYNVRLRNPEE